jgi:hypothetical protein
MKVDHENDPAAVMNDLASQKRMRMHECGRSLHEVNGNDSTRAKVMAGPRAPRFERLPD